MLTKTNKIIKTNKAFNSQYNGCEKHYDCSTCSNIENCDIFKEKEDKKGMMKAYQEMRDKK